MYRFVEYRRTILFIDFVWRSNNIHNDYIRVEIQTEPD